MSFHSAEHCFEDNHNFSSSLGSYQLKLQSIASEMQLCKAALDEWKLSTKQVVVANRLIGALEESVEELGEAVSSQLRKPYEIESEKSPIDRQIEKLCMLCQQLKQTIFSRWHPFTMPA